MDTNRLQQLAGIDDLNEVVDLSGDLTMDDLIKRMDACRRALSIVNKMDAAEDRKKWLSATFVNLNKVRNALMKIMKAEGVPVDGNPLKRPPMPRQ